MGFIVNYLVSTQRKDVAERLPVILKDHPVPDDIQLYDNVFYSDDHHPEHTMDIYVPKTDDAALHKVIINIHGGGMMCASKEFNRPMCIELAQRGFTVFAIDYPLAPEHSLREILTSVLQAEKRIAEVCTQYNGNPDEIMIMGDSGGAYPALYTTAMLHNHIFAEEMHMDVPMIRIRKLALISPLLYTLQKGPVGMFCKGLLYSNRKTDPVFMKYADPENPLISEHLPDVLLSTSAKDNMRANTMWYDAYLRKTGKQVLLVDQYDPSLGHDHLAFTPDLPASDELLEAVIRFFS